MHKVASNGEGYQLLGSDTTQTNESISVFWRNIQPPSAVSKSKQRTLLGLHLNTEMEAVLSSETMVNFYQVICVTSQNTDSSQLPL